MIINSVSAVSDVDGGNVMGIKLKYTCSFDYNQGSLNILELVYHELRLYRGDLCWY